MRPRGLCHVIRDIRLGLRYGYPPCCVAHFVWDGLWGWPSSMMRWRQFGHVATEPPTFVPCGVFHRGRTTLSLPARLARIVGFQLRHLAPTAAARERRSVACRGSTMWRSAPPALKVRCSRDGGYAELYWGASTANG